MAHGKLDLWEAVKERYPGQYDDIVDFLDSSLSLILTQMQVLEKPLPEYSMVREMGGVGDVLAVKLIAGIGDVRRLHNAKALIAWAGIDPPPYESGQFIGFAR